MSHSTLALLTVPIVTGVIGYVTNWTGVLMLFYPVHFRDWRVPGLQSLIRMLPHKLQQIPGVMVGGIGRVLAQLPEVVHELTDEIGEHIEQLVDIKLMVIKRFDPELANRVFLDMGQRELTFIKNFGFVLAVFGEDFCAVCLPLDATEAQALADPDA